MSVLAACAISKSFGPLRVLDEVSLAIEPGEVVAIIGRSGSGKSTLLRCLCALERVDRGSILFDDRPLSLRPAARRALHREIGVVFQSLNLFPHLTVERNITLGLTAGKGLSGETARQLALEGLQRVDLAEKLHAYPGQLSGGQQQRVAIARALAMQPRVMLFDEPTSALDPELVGEVVRVLEKLSAAGMTMVLVTHEMGFARRAADTVVFMHAGRVWEKGAPDALFARPQTRELAAFFGALNSFS